MPIAAILFDAYGTLLDVASIRTVAERLFPGHGVALSALWRDRQLQYSWLRTLSGRYVDFWQVTGEALDYASAALGLTLDANGRAGLMSQYERLAPFADAKAALAELGRLGVPLAVLSNGTLPMLEAAFGNAGLRQHFAVLLSVDAARRYKVAPAAYQLAVDYFRAAAADLLLISSNGWDVAGAAAFGLTTFWVNRGGAPVEQLGMQPAGMGQSLAEVAGWVAARTQTPR